MIKLANSGIAKRKSRFSGSGVGGAGTTIRTEEERTMEKPTQERHNEARYRVLKGAHIAFKSHGAVIDCVVRNLSDRGACLKVESPIGIPDTFDLVLDHASVRHCRVTWRSRGRFQQPLLASIRKDSVGTMPRTDGDGPEHRSNLAWTSPQQVAVQRDREERYEEDPGELSSRAAAPRGKRELI
jgi:hypothetical protein